MRPLSGGRNPLMMENSVVLPAPFGPMSAAIRPASTESETSSRARSPPKRLLTCSTQSNGSATGTLRRQCAPARQVSAHVGEQAGNTVARKSHDENERAAVDDEVEARCIAG